MTRPIASWNEARVYMDAWRNQDGTLKAGNYTVDIPVRITNSTDDEVAPAGRHAQGELNSTNPDAFSLDIMVPVTDDPDNEQTGWKVVIVVTFTDGSLAERYVIDVPYANRPVDQGGNGLGVNLRQVAISQNLPTQLATYRVGAPGGLAKLGADGKPVDSDGNPVGGGGGTWGSIPDKPLTFPPSGHVHAIADVEGLATTLANVNAQLALLQARVSALEGNPVITKLAGGLVVVDPTKLANTAQYGVDQSVMKASSGVSWAALNPQPGVFNWKPIDDLLAAYPDTRFTLRIQSGETCPAWLAALTGVVEVYNKARGVTVNVCHWWEAVAMDAWREMILAAGVRYDNNPRIVMVSADAPMVVYSEPYILGNDGPSGVRLYNAGLNQTTMLNAIKRCVDDTAEAFPNTLVELAIHENIQIPTATGITSNTWPLARQFTLDLCNTHGRHLCLSDYGLASLDNLAAHTPTGTITTETDVYAWMNLRANGGSAAWAGPISFQLTVGKEPQTQTTYVNSAESAASLGGQMCETAAWGLAGSECVRLDGLLKTNAARVYPPVVTPPPPPTPYQPLGVLSGGGDGSPGPASSYALTLPAGAQAGQRVLVMSSLPSASATASILSGSGGAWTVLAGPDAGGTGTGTQSYLWSKVLESSDLGQPITVTWTSSSRGMAHGIVFPAGIASSVGLAAIYGGVNTLTCAGVTAKRGDTLVILGMAKINSGIAVPTASAPSGYTLDGTGATTGNPSINWRSVIAHKNVIEDGVEGSVALQFSANANGISAYSVALTKS